MKKNIKNMNMAELESHLFEIAETTSHQYIAEQFEGNYIHYYSFLCGDRWILSRRRH